jgi:hypothetical protein
LSPVLRSAADIQNAPEFATAEKKLVPDPAIYADWFNALPPEDKRRKAAVGVRRYNTVKDKLGRPPRWEDFLDHETGDLVPTDTLAQEAPEEAATRTARAVDVVHQRRERVQQVSGFGFEFTPNPPTLDTFRDAVNVLPDKRVNIPMLKALLPWAPGIVDQLIQLARDAGIANVEGESLELLK